MRRSCPDGGFPFRRSCPDGGFPLRRSCPDGGFPLRRSCPDGGPPLRRFWDACCRGGLRRLGGLRAEPPPEDTEQAYRSRLHKLAINRSGEPNGSPLSAKSGGDLLSQGVSTQVPSALVGLTSVFGMGTGVTPPPSPPKPLCSCQRGRASRTPQRARTSVSTSS